MNWTIESHHDPDFVRINTAGTANVIDCERMVNDILSQDFWRTGAPLLINCLELDVRDIRYDDVDQSGMIFRSRRLDFGSCRMAIIALPGLNYGVSRQFKSVTEGRTSINIQIFLDESAAIEWLSQALDSIPPHAADTLPF